MSTMVPLGTIRLELALPLPRVPIHRGDSVPQTLLAGIVSALQQLGYKAEPPKPFKRKEAKARLILGDDYGVEMITHQQETDAMLVLEVAGFGYIDKYSNATDCESRIKSSWNHIVAACGEVGRTRLGASDVRSDPPENRDDELIRKYSTRH